MMVSQNMNATHINDFLLRIRKVRLSARTWQLQIHSLKPPEKHRS